MPHTSLEISLGKWFIGVTGGGGGGAARAPQDAAGGVQGDGGEVSAGAAVGRGSVPGMEAAAPEAPAIVAKRRRPFPAGHRLFPCRNPGGKRQTASLTSSGCPWCGAVPAPARGLGCEERGMHWGGSSRPLSLCCQKKGEGAGAAEQPGRLGWVMEWLLGCGRLASRVDRSIDKTLPTSSFAELLSWCRTWSCMGMSQPRPGRVAEAVAGEKGEGVRMRPGWGSPRAGAGGRGPASPRRCCCGASHAFPTNSSGLFLK